MLNLLENKRVIFVFGSLDLGGAERQGLLLAEGLKSKFGDDVKIWGIPKGSGRISRLCEEKGIPWRGLDFNWGKTGFTRVISLTKLALTLRRERPDIILSYTTIPNLACGIVWRYSGARLFVWNQRDEGLLLNKKWWHRLAVGRTLHFLCNSGAGRAFLESFYGVESKRISLIHNGIILGMPAASREEWRQRLSLTEETPVACMLSNIHRNKDHETLLRAWAIVHGHWTVEPKPVLLLAGRIDEDIEPLRKLVCEMGESVRFLGSVDDVPGLLTAIDLCVHSCRSEGLPNAVLEAMAAGVPVVATDIPGIREAVGDDSVALLSPPGDADIFSKNIIQMLRNEEIRASAGEKNPRRIANEFSMEKMWAETVAFLTGGYISS